MYEAKRLGGNRLQVFEPRLRRPAADATVVQGSPKTISLPRQP